MQKYLLLILLSIFSLNTKAQCFFTGMVSGDSVTVGFSDTLSPFFNIDSVVFDFGDGSTFTGVNTPPSSLYNFITSHQYAVNGTYSICMQEYTSWGGAPQPPCSYCDVITIGSVDSCDASAAFTYNASGLDVGFIDISVCLNCIVINYLWDFGDGVTSIAPNPIHTYLTDGVYVTCLTMTGISNSGSNCMDIFCVPVPVGNVGIDHAERKQLSIYPNPVSNSVSVVIPENASNISFLLTDLTGRTVWSEIAVDVKKGLIEIDMHLYSSGIYLLRMITDEAIYDSKLIKE